MKKLLTSVETMLLFTFIKGRAVFAGEPVCPDPSADPSGYTNCINNSLKATGSPINIPTPATGVKIITDLGKLISSLVVLILIISALAAFIWLIQGGLKWITSGGDKAGVDAARNQIQAALLGLFIVFGAWALMMVVERFLGVSILRGINIPTPF